MPLEKVMETDAPAGATQLDVNAKQKVSYCIPLEVRDLQIQASIRRVAKRIEPGPPRAETVALACFGPSLNDTWRDLLNYDYVISCSGSHKFLVERGIIPTWHVEVDPRPHKVALIGPPHPDVTYLIASTCHGAVFDHLEGMDVRLWHVFDSKEEGIRILPPGEWALTGGCDVGSRALTIAGFLGFRDVHVFGMDGSQQGDDKHAAAHPNEAKKYSTVTYDGVEYRTTPAMLEAARQIWHELDQMPKVRATFHGTGLVQAMAKHYVPREDTAPAKLFENQVAYMRPTLITPEYAALNARLHREKVEYGVGGARHAASILKLCTSFETTSVLDYGCGKSQLAAALPFPIWEYDPGVPGKEDSPRAADIVVCTDVLEHIEPELLMNVLADLHRVTRRVLYVVIHTGASSKRLGDGRNAHLIQRDRAWWSDQLRQLFAISPLKSQHPLLTFVATPKPGRVVLVPSPAPSEPSCKTPPPTAPSSSSDSPLSSATNSASPRKAKRSTRKSRT